MEGVAQKPTYSLTFSVFRLLHLLLLFSTRYPGDYLLRSCLLLESLVSVASEHWLSVESSSALNLFLVCGVNKTGVISTYTLYPSLITVSLRKQTHTMCEFLPVYHKPTGCVAFPKHVVEVRVYLACLEIINDAAGTKERCDDKDCHLVGSLGSTRTRAECAHCIAASSSLGVIEPLYIVIRDQEFASLIGQGGLF